MNKKAIIVVLSIISLSISPVTSFSSDNVVVEQAKGAGIEKNLKTIESLSEFLIGNAQNSGTHSIWFTDAGDRRIFSSMIESAFGDDSILNFMVVTPDLDSTAPDYTYVRFFYEPKTMIDTREQLFGDWAYKGVIAQNIVRLEKGDIHVYLMQAGAGTLVVRRELGAGF